MSWYWRLIYIATFMIIALFDAESNALTISLPNLSNPKIHHLQVILLVAVTFRVTLETYCFEYDTLSVESSDVISSKKYTD